MTKKELRQLIRERKKQHTTQQLQSFSQNITQSLLERIHSIAEGRCATNLQNSSSAHRSLTILLYHSLPDEVSTHNLIHTLHAQGHTILLPTVNGDELTLHTYEGASSLATGTSFGIQESAGPLFTDYQHIDLAIIPGMAFTPQGDRLGRGHGYYDRLLPHLSCPLIGLAFPFQLLPFIPCEAHDIRMTEVITSETC